MPNHIVNQLVIIAKKKRVQEVLLFIKGETDEDGTVRYVDFNKIVPMPQDLFIDSSSEGDRGMKYLLAKQKRYFLTPEERKTITDFEESDAERQEKAIKLGRQYLRNIANYGHKDWYDWSLVNWGTKWNAYDTQMTSPNVITFNTAWSGVPALIQKLSEMFPDVTFEYTYADEDTGSNTGKGSFQNGESDMFYPETHSKEAFEIAFEMRPYLRDYYVSTEDGYRYVDADDESEEENS